ncbi:hypothetical protein B7L09_23125 [Pseudomonas mandelii]|nr:hypothetical protein B7L09_23125 [Pseudomonas mandelii]
MANKVLLPEKFTAALQIYGKGDWKRGQIYLLGNSPLLAALCLSLWSGVGQKRSLMSVPF